MDTITIERLMSDLNLQPPEYKNIARKLSLYEQSRGLPFVKEGSTKRIPVADAEIFKLAHAKVKERKCRTYAAAFEGARTEIKLQQFQRHPTSLLKGIVACDEALTQLDRHAVRLKPDRDDFGELEEKFRGLREQLNSMLEALNDPANGNFTLSDLSENGTQAVLNIFVALAQVVRRVIRLEDLLREQLDVWRPRDDRAYAALGGFVGAVQAQPEECSPPDEAPADPTTPAPMAEPPRPDPAPQVKEVAPEDHPAGEATPPAPAPPTLEETPEVKDDSAADRAALNAAAHPLGTG